ncbi:ABC transporter permease [Lentibacillus saliphilus]|uniref:ABC transporter permease n=1 Tax=Lentibacillus saliphilus TaxID=2737028 RepID=UPI001C2F888D|nr:hypothetical protein [Lentibacillus saliphilus]
MRGLIWQYMKRQMVANLAFMFALLLIIVVLPLTIVSLNNIHQKIESDISYYARGTYDLLVRSPENKHPLEEELGIVPDNYIGFGHGGIALEDWETLKQNPDIDIAAPVSSLGYFTGIRSNMTLKPPASSTRYSVQFSTSDGINDYPMGDKQECILLEPSTSERFNFQPIISDIDLLNMCDQAASFYIPASYHLLVGIDPEEEEKLTGIPFEMNRMGWGKTAAIDSGLPDAHIMPVLELEHDTAINLAAQIKLDRLDVDAEKMAAYSKQLDLENEPDSLFLTQFHTPKYKALTKDLLTMDALATDEFQADIASRLNVFFQEPILMNESGHMEDLVADGEFFGVVDLNHSAQYYLAGYPSYEMNGDTITVNKVSDFNNIPVYRTLEQKGVHSIGDASLDDETKKDVSFIPDPIGTVKIPKQNEQLASSPLGIYQFQPAYHIHNETGEKTPLQPTATPGSFLPIPAKGITNIEAAAHVKGERPIDAIRVKVAGIEGYTDEAVTKIEKIAKDIEAMGYEVTMIAGASPQKIQFEVEDVGLVEESWTTLGAAGTIVSEWSVTNLVLGVLFIVVAVTYVTNRQFFWHINKKQDILLFNKLGWQTGQVLQFFRKEMIYLLGFSAVFSLPVLYALNQWLLFPNSIYMWLTVDASLIILFMLLLTTRKIHTVMKQTSISTDKRSKERIKGQSLIVKNIKHFSSFIKAPFFQFISVSMLASFVYLSLTETVEKTNLTLLGEYINVQTSEWHVILMAAAFLLTVFTLIESLTSLLHVRQKEIVLFNRIGWKQRHIKTLYMGEVAVWSGIAIALGTILSGLTFSVLYTLNQTMLLRLGASFLGFYLIVLTLSFVVIHYRLNRKHDRETMKQVG